MKLTIIVATFALAMTSAYSVKAATYKPIGPIERKYAADGPWAVTVSATAEACDSEGHVCDLLYPSVLGSDPNSHSKRLYRHPVVIIADGTADTVDADVYAYFMRHLATWGFVVVRSRDGATGQGRTVIDSANYIVARNSDPGSRFYQRLDPTNIGVVGHSQGAGTALVLFGRQEPIFKTYVAIETPVRPFCIVAKCAPDLASLPRVVAGSVFLIGGQLDPVSTVTTNLGYYGPVSASVDKVLGMITAGSHLEIQGNPTCPANVLPASCNIGVYPLLGYPTAWLMWKLHDAEDARDAFRVDGELAHAAPNWTSVLTNVR